MKISFRIVFFYIELVSGEGSSVATGITSPTPSVKGKA